MNRFFRCVVLFLFLFQIAEAGPVKVFILAGQSNMEGKAKVSLLEHQAKDPDTAAEFAHLVTEDGFVERDDVWIRFLDRHGNLAVGYGSPDRIGPELQFGIQVGDHFENQVLIIKTAWGGKSLFRDFRPPGAGLPSEEILEGLLENAQKKSSETTMEDVEASFGQYYRQMIEQVDATLKNLSGLFPGYEEQGYEICGFVWFQGWNDMVNDHATSEYAENMAQFIRDVRKDLKEPELPFVIGQLGVGGVNPPKPNEKRDAFKAAQAVPAALPEFSGNVAVVRTDQYWDKVAFSVFEKGWRENLDEWETVGSDYPFHYLGSVRTMLGIGGGFADSVLSLQP